MLLISSDFHNKSVKIKSEESKVSNFPEDTKDTKEVEARCSQDLGPLMPTMEKIKRKTVWQTHDQGRPVDAPTL